MTQFTLPGHPGRTELDSIQDLIPGKKTEITKALKVSFPVPEGETRSLQAIHRRIAREEFDLKRFRHRPDDKPDRFSTPEPDLPDQITYTLLAAAVGGPEKLAKAWAQQMVIEGKDGMPTEERAALLAKLRKDLRDLEIREEREICRLEALGHAILRRADIDAQLVREVWRGLAQERPRKHIPRSATKIERLPHLNDGAKDVHAPLDNERT